MRQHETEILTKSGQNPDGSFHIPIDQAMDMVASRGLAAQTTNVPAVSPHTTIKQNALAPGEQAPAGISGDIGAPPAGAAKP
jgi:hypothetical protein